LKSVIADSGAMLTQVRMEMLPGDKRLLAVTLPKNAQFWFAYVDQNGVWPWREGEQFLIPLEQQTERGKVVPVEIFYSSQIGEPDATSRDLHLQAPKFDLPLENIEWKVYVNDQWNVKDWSGTLQKSGEQLVPHGAVADVRKYLEEEIQQQREKTKAAEEALALGNKALEQGDPQGARRAFGDAYELSQHDLAFNEDARVQLHNIKLQQALVGLNVRKNEPAAAADAVVSKLRSAGREPSYTQQDAKQLIDKNSADENAALTKLAERLIQQQDAAVPAPTAIQASVPEQGRMITFSRSVAVDPQAELHVELEVGKSGAASMLTRVLILAVVALLFAFALWPASLLRRA
jgi:hypothetical protein